LSGAGSDCPELEPDQPFWQTSTETTKQADCKHVQVGEPLWLSGKVVKNEKINEIERTRVRSPPRATFFKKN
jgi:hypothetical protein